MIAQLVQAIFSSTADAATCGHEWPTSAEFAIVERCSTWPNGWQEGSYITFFDTREQLDAHIARMRKWERLEDNLWAFRTYQWDLGPEQIDLGQFEGTPHTTRDRVSLAQTQSRRYH